MNLNFAINYNLKNWMFNQNENYIGIYFFIKHNFIDLSNLDLVIDYFLENYNLNQFERLYNIILGRNFYI